MSNTYFKFKKTVETKGFSTFEDYTNEYTLSLTAVVSRDDGVQLTVQTNSSLPNQSGIAYIVLNDNDIDKLIFGLLERKLRIVSATGYEQSVICSADVEDEKD